MEMELKWKDIKDRNIRDEGKRKMRETTEEVFDAKVSTERR